MDIWRLLDTPPMTAAENMALDETLVELKGQGQSPNTIRFLQFSPRSVLVGYHQSVGEEIRQSFCQANNIEINRRITGGGAIFFDENQLGWEIFCDKSFFNINIPNDRLFKTLCLPVVSALDAFGLKSEFRPRNDIEINGRKISGTGGTDFDAAFMFQGTMLVDFDADTMLRALKIPVEKLKAKEIDSFKERVTCLNWELGFTPELSDIKQAVSKGFESNLGIRLERDGLTLEEENLFRKKLDKFKSDEWIDRVRPVTSPRETIQATYKAKAGMVRYTLAVNSRQKRLKDIYITGDFLSFPSRSLYDLESALRGLPLKRETLVSTIERFFNSGRIVVPGMKMEDFVKPLDIALEKIEISRFGIPLEYCNRISVTNGSFKEIIESDPKVLLLPYCAKLAECDLRYEKTCRRCGHDTCSIGPAWQMGLDGKKRVISIVSFEDLWEELMRMKQKKIKSFIGCCCQPFFAKHIDDFAASGIPGILIDIDNTTCYDLDQAKEAYAGRFENQTQLDLNLLNTVLNAVPRQKAMG